MTPKALTFLLVSILCAASGQILMRLGVQGRDSVSAMLNPFLFMGFGMYALSSVLWILVISRVSLTLVYPATALTICVVYLAAVLFLGETLTLGKIAGVSLIIMGLGCIWITQR